MMEIRQYRDADFRSVMSLWKECGLIVPGSDYALDIKKKTEYQPALFFVGTIENRMAGSIMAGYDGRRGWLNCLAVLPEYQKKGYGKLLVEFGIAELAKLGCVKVNVQVRKTNIGVLEFYHKLGFSEDKVVSLGKRLV